jgi:predicted secreted hydrolase
VISALLLAATLAASGVAPPPDAEVRPGHALEFPRDHGSHPGFRTEWWYLTGWLDGDGQAPRGFQLTVFRVKGPAGSDDHSSFAPHQLLIAHAALSDPSRGRLLREEHLAREGLGLAQAEEARLSLRIDRIRLEASAGAIELVLPARDFALRLRFREGVPLLHGDGGYSPKALNAGWASEYYSLPQLEGAGELRMGGAVQKVRARAWLDHEWTSVGLEPGAQGWDWVGINLADGGALMAFRTRGADGQVRFAAATLSGPDGRIERYPGAAVRFEWTRRFRSPRSGIEYPVEGRVVVGDRAFQLRPLFDDQESDARLSTGARYYEGAVRALESGREAGRGYLELTGYGERLQLPEGRLP